MAWAAVSAACAAVCCIQATYGAAADAMASDDGPTQGPAVRPNSTDEYDAAADCSSAARFCHAVAAATNDPAPGPLYIRPELNSGGKAP